MGELTKNLVPVEQVNTKFVSEVSPEALQELFSRDPEKLNDQDVQVIVDELRKQRKLFKQQEETKPKRAKRKAAPKKTMSKEQASQLTLGSLGLLATETKEGTTS